MCLSVNTRVLHVSGQKINNEKLGCVSDTYQDVSDTFLTRIRHPFRRVRASSSIQVIYIVISNLEQNGMFLFCVKIGIQYLNHNLKDIGLNLNLCFQDMNDPLLQIFEKKTNIMRS